jgi:hypothetical protein
MRSQSGIGDSAVEESAVGDKDLSVRRYASGGVSPLGRQHRDVGGGPAEP